jgi:hypothetical protein
MAVAVDAGILTILIVADRTVKGATDLPAFPRVAVAEMSRVQPTRLSDKWS